jgi:arginyl-tRNA synthetase
VNAPQEIIRSAVEKAIRRLSPDSAVPVQVENPADSRNGDYSTNVALRLAPILHRPPMEIAQDIATKLALPLAKSASVAQPGFVNITVKSEWLARRVREVVASPRDLVVLKPKKRERVNVEFLSANPTGPLHLGNGRGGFMGDVLANTISAAGHLVRREYYVNDVGKQIDTLAESVTRRYFQAHGLNIPYPETNYQGEYVKELSARVNFGKLKLGNLESTKKRIARQVVRLMLKDIERDVEKKFHIHFDRWFFQSELERTGLVEKLMGELESHGHTFEQDGALWLRTTTFGDDKDRVLVKANGERTYYLADIAYHYDKLVKRKFDRAIDFLGADHHGYIGRLQAAVKIFGSGRLDVVILQLVRLVSGGEEVRMSKRSGTFVTLNEVVDEVGLDVARWFFLSRAADTHLDFDLDLAKQHSVANPVFYAQYAHARACSILAKVKALGRKAQSAAGKAVWSERERALALTILRLPEVIADTAADAGVHRIPAYTTGLARAFHNFYDTARVLENDTTLIPHRLELVRASKGALAAALKLMGISAPERMEKVEAPT